MIVSEWLFLICLSACAYVYAGYPALLAVLAHLRPRAVQWARVRPPLTVVVPAYNEEAVIERKIRDTLANGYPEELLEIIVASDGSTDRTNEIVQRMAGARVRLLPLPRSGKAFVLNAAAAIAKGEVLVFTDADVCLDPGALERLVGNFADPAVGGVTGRKAHIQGSGAGALVVGEGLYTRFDEWQKQMESRIASTVAAHGALHAVRRELYVPIRDASEADDMAISMRVVLLGKRLVYEKDAVARVAAPQDVRTEFARKIRIANQVMRALLGLGSALWTSGFYSVQLISHKLLRYWVPVFLALMLAANVQLASSGHTQWQLVIVAQLALYGAAVIEWLARERGQGSGSRLLAVPYYFCAVNAAAFAALLSVARGRRSGTWTPGGGFQEPRTGAIS